MNFYDELNKIIDIAKEYGARTGRSIGENTGLKPDNTKLKNYTYQLASNFANKFYELIGVDYRDLQTKETEITLAKSNLDNRARDLCIAKEEKKGEQQFLIRRIENLKKRKSELLNKINEDTEKKNDLEELYLKPDTEGDLKQMPMWIFVAIMTVVGLAEMLIYQSVFLSQEIGILAEMEEDKVAHLENMALIMGTGFIVMITWLAHEAGKRIRHIEGTAHKNRLGQWIKVGLIMLLVIAAIFSTVKMRSDMHKSSELNAKLTTIIDAEEDADDEDYYSEDSESDEDADDEDSDDDEDEDEDEDSDDELAGDEGSTTPTLTEKEQLEKELIDIKSDGAWYFMAINFFIFMGGVMLAYHTHTSSVRYEQLIALIAKQRKELEELEKKKFGMLDHLKNDEKSVTDILKPWWKKIFSPKKDESARENNKLEIVEAKFMNALTAYITLVNEYDAQREEIHSKADATVSSYINAVRSYIDALTDYAEVEFDAALYSDDELERIINVRTKLAKYLELRQDNEQELLHINSIDDVISKIDCHNDEMNSYFEAFKAAEATDVKVRKSDEIVDEDIDEVISTTSTTNEEKK